MSQITKHLEIAVNDANSGRITKKQLMEIFQDAIDNGDILAKVNEIILVGSVLPLIDNGVLHSSDYVRQFEREMDMQLTSMAQKSCKKERRYDYPNYFLPAGIGIAFGIFDKGFFVYWPFEVVVFACIWSMRGVLMKTWTYRTYTLERSKIGLNPSPIIFVVLQTVVTIAFVFAIAITVVGIKNLLV